MSFDYHEIDAFTPATAVSVCHPKGELLPLLFEFPHSGNRYPKDFRPSKDVPIQQIISGADSYMDELFEDYQALGITGIHANFPRVYLDANRHQHDIARDLLSDKWYGRSQPTTTEGTGLVWTIAQNPLKMYDRPLSDDEIRNRLSLCFIPYHQTLTMELEQLRRRFGKVYMLGCHSMRHHGFDDKGHPTKTRPEIDLGHRNYQTCERGYVECIADAFSDLGYDVRHGEQYAGGENMLRYGWPSIDQHALQIEIRRDFYMNEDTREKGTAFDSVQRHCQIIAKAAASYVRDQL